MTYSPYHTDSKDEVVYRRKPSPAEIRFGYGCTHYVTFPRDYCTKPDGKLKKWVTDPATGIRCTR